MTHLFVTKLNKTVLSKKGLETALGELVRNKSVNKSVTNLGPMNQINPTTMSLIYKAFQILWRYSALSSLLMSNPLFQPVKHLLIIYWYQAPASYQLNPTTISLIYKKIQNFWNTSTSSSLLMSNWWFHWPLTFNLNAFFPRTKGTSWSQWFAM